MIGQAASETRKFAATRLMHMGLDDGALRGHMDRMKVVDANCSVLARIATISAGYPFRGKVDELPDSEVAVIQMHRRPVNGIDWPNLSRVALPRVSAKAFLAEDIFDARRAQYRILYGGTAGTGRLLSHFFVIRAGGKRFCRSSLPGS